MYLGDDAFETTVRGAKVKVRDPWRVGIFSLITLGVYVLVWFYKVNRELYDYASQTGVRWVGVAPVIPVVGILLGGVGVWVGMALIGPVGALFSLVELATWIWFCVRVSLAQKHAGVGGWFSPGYVLVMVLLSLVPLGGTVVFFEWLQMNLNIVWTPAGNGGETALRELRPSLA